MTRLYRKKLMKLAKDDIGNIDNPIESIQKPMEEPAKNDIPLPSDDKQALDDILDKIETAADNLKDIYYVLFDNLNAIYDSYPEIYEQLQMIIKLPTNDDAEEIVAFNNDIKSALSHFRNKSYVNSYLENKTSEVE